MAPKESKPSEKASDSGYGSDRENAPGTACTPEGWKIRVNYTSSLTCEKADYGSDLAVGPGWDKATVYRYFNREQFAKHFPLGPLNDSKVLLKMRPSFVLCSKILTTRAISEPWIRAMLGRDKLAFDDNSRLNYYDVDTATVDRTLYEQFQKELEELEIRFMFVGFKIDETKGQQTHGMHLQPNEPIGDDEGFCFAPGTNLSDLDNIKQYHRIHINAAYYDYFSQTNQKRASNSAKELLTYFALGVTLAHEIYHTFCSKHRDYDEKKPYIEPFYDMHQIMTTIEPELGAALEETLFGMPTQCSMDRENGAHIETSQEVEARLGNVTEFMKGHWASVVDLDWVAEVMTEKFWKSVKSCRDLHMPPPTQVILKNPNTGKWKWKALKENPEDLRMQIEEFKTEDRARVEEKLKEKLKEMDDDLSNSDRDTSNGHGTPGKDESGNKTRRSGAGRERKRKRFFDGSEASYTGSRKR